MRAEIVQACAGDLMKVAGKDCCFRVSYYPSSLSIFSRLQVSLMRISPEQATCSIYIFRHFFPAVGYLEDEREAERAASLIENGVYPFVRQKDGRLETIVVAAGERLLKRGVFYCPDYGCSEEVPLVEVNGSSVRLLKDNLKLVKEV